MGNYPGWEKYQPKAAVPLPQKSKYRNVRVEVDGERFDSKKEARCWHELKLRQAAGEITDLRHHAPRLGLLAPTPDRKMQVVVSYYEPDFTYVEAGKFIVVDAKGHRTALYALKKKWLELQDGTVIVEV